ncbi:MAG: group 1 glycosyl transferase [uncultured bacterium]|uniref:Glycosyl transferase group 1 n=4 Tax=Candidatus Daviesiibacteriota TaxID=1752718 RepID=A0A0G0HV98_9BACT|nr:MAG: group 1 glycosyl transferase [uncultured bacterium]KKQ07801.1 MAG: Glycosyl transferase group 1 [Candidatus Daviesbacteria bacterium GW2011_GWB1_36_5]KKQ15440.1 MAG: Glycosyl transferase group 1 [Candidatus Daviesbacteria bacterium GW2011_GWA1_36_8]OGE17466.1 MAG: hypothetical protein A2858_00980 [Candidatus Daviesbacteria bacterium RIFCSPHIGHO2_01_FULL_36_37]OGE36561.1 MAG: hypothetical protein A3E66_02825 [Candidatus Daviesbacteria bacterium RIFCSPHIGHO2_12_FULL_37_16]
MQNKLKVGFDISQIAHTGGVGVYTQNLAKNLLNDEDLEMVFFYSSLRKPYKGSLKNVKAFRLPPTMFEVLFNRVRTTKIEKFLGDLDIFHSSDWVQPPSNAKQVTTYHDVIPLKYPGWSTSKIVSVHKRRLKIVEKEIDMVIAVSEATKKDLLEVSQIPEEKIKVIYEGVEERFKIQKKEDIEEFKKKYNLPNNFLMAIGGIGERKNLKRIKEASKDYNLIVLGEDVQVSREELPLLYASAELLVYASLYEGFGLPILEAMACGTLVVTSNVSSMPEIAGEAAVLVKPASVESIRNGIVKALDKNDELVEKGLERAKEFSWEKCAKETAQVYKELGDKE